MESKLQQEQNSDLIKIVLYGPESSGKTSLAIALADHYRTVWVPEFARDYLQEKYDRGEGVCEVKDILPIAEGQIRIENEMAKKAKRVLICDTDILETMVYSEAYYGLCDYELEDYAISNSYDLYFLTDIDTPWIEDDLRDRPDRRAEMFAYFRDALVKHKRPYIKLSGTLTDRVNLATKKIDKLLDKISSLK